ATLALAAVVGLATACSGSPRPGDSPDRLPASIRTVATLTGDGPRPILLYTDLDVDDLVALPLLAGDPAVELLAVTVSGTGTVHCEAGVDIARRWLALLDRAAVPVACGREQPGPGGRAFPAEWRLRADALSGLDLPVVAAPAAPSGSASELIRRTVAAAEGRVTVVAIGPWTNLADAVRADPSLAGRVREIQAMLGTIDAPGNVDLGETHPADRVEWNAGADPDAVATVLSADIPITLVPLDA